MKTVVACPLEGPTLASVKHWLQTRPMEDGPIDFVHVIQRSVYGADFMQVVESPTPEQFHVFRAAFSENIRAQLFPSIPADIRGASQVHILLANDEAEEMIHYLKENKTKLLVVGTRGIHGIAGMFTSSFATKMMKEAPCNLLVLRP